MESADDESHVYLDGAKYQGLQLCGQRHGLGCLEMKDGTKYVGQFAHGLPQGLGYLVAATFKYIGQFKQGKFDGLGLFTLPTGDYFKGQFTEGKVKGMGIFKSTDPVFVCDGVFQQGELVSNDCSETALNDVDDIVQQVLSLIRDIASDC